MCAFVWVFLDRAQVGVFVDGGEDSSDHVHPRTVSGQIDEMQEEGIHLETANRTVQYGYHVQSIRGLSLHPGVNCESRLLHLGPGFLYIAAWPSVPKKQSNGSINQTFNQSEPPPPKKKKKKQTL